MLSSPKPNISTLNFNKGDLVEVAIIRITDFGAFGRLPNGKTGLIHISQVSDTFVKNINDYLKVGDKVKARILEIASDGKIQLTLKKEKDNFSSFPKGKTFKNTSFEEKMKKFLKQSNERLADLKNNIEAKQG
jgi:S1 RNA binding domain protein